MSHSTYKHKESFLLENGKSIDNLQLAYYTYGRLNESRTNVIWAFHALSGSSDVVDWWPGLFGEGCLYDPKKYFIICVNTIGSPYGSSRPTDLTFPHFSVRDVVAAHQLLADALDIQKVHTAIGGSFGGNQALEFAYSFEGTLDHLILISSCSKESAWGIAVHESQRIAMQSDPSFGVEGGGVAGMKAARSMAMLTYRTSEAFIDQQTDVDEKVDNFNAASYIQYQGDKFTNRFNSLCYYYLTKCMDSHNIGRNRGGEANALGKIAVPTLILGIGSDTLIPLRFQKFMTENMPHATFQAIHSKYGHDGFLVETEQITAKVKEFYNQQSRPKQGLKRAVLKFGGKSLNNGHPLENVIEIIKTAAQSNSLAVVVSARGNSTNLLEELYRKALAGECVKQDLENLLDYQSSKHLSCDFQEEREGLAKLLKAISIIRLHSHQLLDRVLAYGEVMSAKFIAQLLSFEGLNTGFVDARKLIVAERRDEEVEVDKVASCTNTTAYFETIDSTFIPIITGFIGSTQNGETVTLGRNGSNYTATLIASFIQACEVQNWTDIDGIYSASPKYVHNAIRLEHLSYREANELANFGATVLHSKTILPLLYSDTPLKINSSNTPKQCGTLIDKVGSSKGIKAVSVVENVSLISIDGKGLLGKVGIDGRIFTTLSKHNISVRIISQASSERGVGFVIDSAYAKKAEIILNKEFKTELAADSISSIRVNSEMAIIAILGKHNFALEKAISGLRKNKIWMHLISNSISGEHISLVIDNKKLKKAVNVVHNQVFGVTKTLNVFVFGKGNVGGKLVDQILATNENTIKERNLRINVIGVADTKKFILNKAGIGENWRSSLQRSGNKSDFLTIVKALNISGLENIVIADNTSSPEITLQYPLIIDNGFDIVASNKKANSIGFDFYKQLRIDLKRKGKVFYYEANVGAGLPIIDTLKHLVRSSDHITRIKGVFSGSLSFIFNTFSEENKAFTDVLEDARKLGYTEPDPRDDLSGTDVARKLLILAREIGLKSEFEEVAIESLVPDELASHGTYEEFLSDKDILNNHFNQIKANLKSNEVLRYTGDLDATKGTLTVSLVKADKSSPMGNITNADSIFEIYTKGYGDQPMVIQGAGAGAEVTARGVYSDLLRVGMQI